MLHQPGRLGSSHRPCEVALSHGQVPTATALLALEVPLVLLPDSPERALLGRRLQQERLGLVPDRPPDQVPYGPLLLQAVGEPELRDAVRRFAERYPPASGPPVGSVIAARIEDLVRG